MLPAQVGQLPLQFIVRIGVDELTLTLACQGDSVKGRHGGVYMTVLDQRPHVPVEKGQQEDADMGTVNIRIGHHDDLVVPGLVDIETGSGPGPDHLDDGGTLLVGQHLRERSLLDVENLPPDGQKGLEHGVPGRLGRTQG